VKPRALIVDDSITVRMDLKDSLEEAGISVALSATAAAARDALARTAFDVVILDVMLPDADGLELLRDLKSDPATAGIPVMLLSSEGEVRDRVRGMAVGADEYLGKPYNRVQVVSRTRALCRKGRSQGREKRLVLVVDDSPSFRGRITEALEEGGYEVAEAANGEDGLRLAAELRPDAMLVDQQMPGLDGVGVLRMLRADAALRRLPCLLLTASQEPDAELRALESGADAYLPKSGETDLVLAKLAALLRSGAGPRDPGSETGTSLLEAKRVLAVDDSPSYLAELSDRLREDAYDVIGAASGEDALQLLAAQSVDAILLDRMMPGLSGQETCRRIKANPSWRDIPLLLLTASQDRQDVLDGIQAGADDYIIKSDDFNVLKARLKAQLRRRQFEDENRVFRERILRQEMEALEMQAVKELAESRAAHIAALEENNRELSKAREEALALAKELESFSYSVSHDLRAPLRSIDGFSLALMEDDAERLDEAGMGHLRRIRAATQRMGQLIDDMLGLAKVSRKEMALEDLDLSDMVRRIGEELAAREPGRKVRLDVQPDLRLKGDAGLVRILLENLLNNAWKFTKGRDEAHIAFFAETTAEGNPAFTLRDDGAGFDMAYAHKLFGVFQRLHSAAEFPGTGVGLATVSRIVGRHRGRIWAEGRPGEGAAFHFTW
jgi:two-component system NtrC family sensor kinase